MTYHDDLRRRIDQSIARADAFVREAEARAAKARRNLRRAEVAFKIVVAVFVGSVFGALSWCAS